MKVARARRRFAQARRCRAGSRGTRRFGGPGALPRPERVIVHSALQLRGEFWEPPPGMAKTLTSDAIGPIDVVEGRAVA